MSFREKSIGASLLITLVVWGFYFQRVYQHWQQGALDIANIGGLLLGAVILTIILEVVTQSVIAAHGAVGTGEGTGAPRQDERDRAIVYRANYYGSYVLGAGVVMAVIAALATQNLVFTLNILIMHFIASEVFVYLLQLYFYRRGL